MRIPCDAASGRMTSRATCSNCAAPLLPVIGRFVRGLCLRCAMKWPHESRAFAVAADPEQWSDKSKRSRSYHKGATICYYDEYYWCAKCGAACVFTAAEQKHRYESLKRYIFQRRKYCDACWKKNPGNAAAG